LGFGDGRRAVGGAQQRRSQGHANKGRRNEAARAGGKWHFHVIPVYTKLLFGSKKQSHPAPMRRILQGVLLKRTESAAMGYINSFLAPIRR
jgi:hypothetical protein